MENEDLVKKLFNIIINNAWADDDHWDYKTRLITSRDDMYIAATEIVEFLKTEGKL